MVASSKLEKPKLNEIDRILLSSMNRVGGTAGGGLGWRRQEKFPVNLWMTPDING